MTKAFHRPEAIRFLEQALWGPTDSDVGAVLGRGLPGLARGSVLGTGLELSGQPDLARRHPRQLRRPVPAGELLALSAADPLLQERAVQLRPAPPARVRGRSTSVVVVSGDTHPVHRPSSQPYLHILDVNAFGKLSRHPVSGHAESRRWASSSTWTPAPSTTPTRTTPARSCSSSRSGPRSSTWTARRRTTARASPCPTYDQSVIDEFKRVYTGWYVPEIPCPPPNGADTCADWVAPMSFDPDYHDTDQKILFAGFLPNPTTLPPDQTGVQDLNGAIDATFQHPNVGPYVARELIHSLVTPNPSPPTSSAWRASSTTTARACAATSGRSSRRSCSIRRRARAATDPLYGHLKEPVLYATNLLRASSRALRATARRRATGTSTTTSATMGQSVFRRRPSSPTSRRPTSRRRPRPACSGPSSGS